MAHLDSNILAKRVIDALRMMYQGPIKHARDVRHSFSTGPESRLATVNLTGSPSYRITVTANAQGCIALAQAMFECTEREVTGIMIDDAMCELANMTSGQVKGLIAPTHRVKQLGIVRGDQLERNAKLLVGTCLRLPGANAEISILLAEAPLATVRVVGASIGAVADDDESASDAKADLHVPPVDPATVNAMLPESSAEAGGISAELERSIAQGTSIKQDETIGQSSSVEPFSPIERGLLVELSAVTIDSSLEELSSHSDEPVSSHPGVKIATANSQDIGGGAALSEKSPIAAEAGFEEMSIDSDLSANVVVGMQESERSAPPVTSEAQSKPLSAEASSTLSDAADGQTTAAAGTTAPGEHLSSVAASDALNCLPVVFGAVNETPPAIESTESLMQESASVVEATHSITSHAQDSSVDASICVNDPAAAAGANSEEYQSVNSSADLATEGQYLSIVTTQVIDQAAAIRPIRRRRPPVGEDDRFRVMIAQRNEASLKVIRRAVLGRNMRLVAIARDGEEAVSEALRVKPDLLCLDLNLDRQDGLQVLTRIRSELPTLTVAIVSASATMPQVRRAMELQVVSIIVSPLTHSRLTAELARIAPFTLQAYGRRRTCTDVSSPLASDQMSFLQ